MGLILYPYGIDCVIANYDGVNPESSVLMYTNNNAPFSNVLLFVTFTSQPAVKG